MSSHYTHKVGTISCATIDPMHDKHERDLAAAADEYQAATNAQKEAAQKLADAMRAAYADNEQQSAILRAAKHVWSREYLRIVLGLTKKRSTDDR